MFLDSLYHLRVHFKLTFIFIFLILICVLILQGDLPTFVSIFQQLLADLVQQLLVIIVEIPTGFDFFI